MDQDEIAKRYRAIRRQLEDLHLEVDYALHRAMERSGIKTHSIGGRVKDLESFVGKIARKEYGDPFAQTDDLVGIRVVCLFLDDLEEIGRIIRETFLVVSETDHVEPSDPASFGYMSLHYVAQIRPEHSGPRYDLIKDMRFEIQTRTVLMDAWANVSHHLDYKTESSIPSELMRDFQALSGLFYVADKHFQMFFSQGRASRARATESIEEAGTPNLDQEINLDTLTAYLRETLPHHKPGGSKSTSELVDELARAGYKKISELDAVLNEHPAEFERSKARSPSGKGDSRFQDVGVIRVTLKDVSPPYAEIYRRKHFGE